MVKLKEASSSSSPRLAKITRLGGATESSQHTINEEEKEQFVHHINSCLATDPDLSHRFPIDGQSHQIFSECEDGLLLW